MACAVCLQTNKDAKGLYNDCIIEYLEKIKSHYIHFKSQLDDKNQAIEKLRATNTDLTDTLARLSLGLKSSPKRRKTHSFEDSAEESVADNLNEALNCEDSWDESFFLASQKAPKNNPNEVLKETNTPTSNPQPTQTAPTNCLPRRLNLKSPLAFRRQHPTVGGPSTPVGVENHDPKWISKENMKLTKHKLVAARDWNMSFIQPNAIVKKGSPVKETSPRTATNRLSVKSEANLKQTRLKFNTTRDETPLPDTDETFCDDFITPSPTSLEMASDEHKQRQRTSRKYGRNRLQLSSDSTKKIDSNQRIKKEPSTVKKVLNLDLKPSKLKPPHLTPPKESPNRTAAMPDCDDSSLIILPSQPDDIILVEETDHSYDINIDSEALLDEMQMQRDETSDFLKNIENQCILNLKNKQDKKNNETLKTTTRDTVSKIIPKWNCKECESFYRVAGRSLSDEELAKRVSNCANNHRQVTYETPEGFWNPCFKPTQEDDPRNQTLIDTRFVDKRKN